MLTKRWCMKFTAFDRDTLTTKQLEAIGELKRKHGVKCTIDGCAGGIGNHVFVVFEEATFVVDPDGTIRKKKRI